MFEFIVDAIAFVGLYFLIVDFFECKCDKD